MIAPRPALTMAEAAAALRVSPEFVRRALRRGELTGYRAGRGLRVYADSLAAYQEGRPAALPVSENMRLAHKYPLRVLAALHKLGVTY